MSAFYKIVPGLLGFLKGGLGDLLGWAEGAAKDNPKTALGAVAVGGSMYDPTMWHGVFAFIAKFAAAMGPLVK